MAWNTEYNLTFPDYFGTQWDIDIQTEDFVGDITDLIGTGNPVKISYEPMEYFTHTPIKASYCEINLIETVDDTFKKFFTKDKAAKVRIYKGSDLYWQGWSTAEGYHSLYNLCPKPVTLTFIDGLSFLKSRPLNVADTGAAAIDEVGIFSLNKYFKQAFEAIGFGCNIYESFNLYDYRVNQALSPFTETHLDTWCFYRKDLDEKYESLYDVLSKVLTSWGARIYQKDGCWYMDHIRQLNDGSITYRRYNSALTYQASASEDRTYNITARSGSPLLVPINHSLYKELERPYSKFILSSNYRLDKELIRYKEVYTEQDIDSEIVYNNLNVSATLFPDDQQSGITWSLGIANINSDYLPIKLITISISGMLSGSLHIYLYIENTLDGKQYYYNISNQILPTRIRKLWYEWDNNSTNYIIGIENADGWDSFSETIDIIMSNIPQDLSGMLYLRVVPPYSGSAGDAGLSINLDDLNVTYQECNKSESKYELVSSDVQTNEKEYEIDIYSDPSISYINSNLVYPGLFYYYDGSEYQQCLNFKYGTDEQTSIERFLINDIMSFYSTLRFKISGTLLGQIDFGKILDYDSKRYMIVSFGYSLKSSQNEVTTIQISEVGSYLLNEDGTYILTEDGNKIPI